MIESDPMAVITELVDDWADVAEAERLAEHCDLPAARRAIFAVTALTESAERHAREHDDPESQQAARALLAATGALVRELSGS